jgi:hypothetical protein
MAITVKHLKVSAIPDDADTSLVRPSDWNADHTFTGTIDIANGGTGQTTANAAFNALVPSQTGNTGKYLTTNGTDSSWSVNPLGTVTSVGTGTGLTGGPITTSGTISIDSTVATLTGTQTLTNKTLTSPIVNEILDTNGNEILSFTPVASATDFIAIKNGIGVGAPLHISAAGSSANVGLHIEPKGTGLVTISDGTDATKGIRFRSSGSSPSAVTLIDAVSTAGHVVTLPDATTTLVGRNTTDTLTNKSISGSTNTLSNIGNSSLTNSAITINGTSTSLGGSINVGTVTSVDLTASTGISVSGGPITGSGSITVTNTAPDQVVSLTGAGTTSISGTYPNFTITSNDSTTGTVTSVAALTLGTTGTDLSSTVANSTTTPVITLQVPTASATNRGALSSTDWSTFNGKANAFTYTTNYIPYGQGTTTPTQSANLTFDGTSLTAPVQRASNGIVTNNKTIGTSFTIPATDNAMSSGPVTLSSGVTVTVSSGSRWVVL